MMRICVADDEKQVREGVLLKLRDCHPHAEIFDAGFGRGALDTVLAVRPDLLFVDIRMPELDGLAILREVKRVRPLTEVVVLTGYEEFEYARTALEGGAFNYIVKPADKEQLRRLVNEVCERMAVRWKEQLGGLYRQMAAFGADSPVMRGGNLSPWFDERVGKTVIFRQSVAGVSPADDNAGQGRAGCADGSPDGGDTDAGRISKLDGPQEGGHANAERIPNPDGLEAGVIGTIDFGIGASVIVLSSAYPSGAVFYLPEQFPQAWTTEYIGWESRRFYGMPPGSDDRPESPATHVPQHRWKTASPESNQARRLVLQAVKENGADRLAHAVDLWLNALEGMRVDLLKRECERLLTLLDESLTGERPSNMQGRDWMTDIAAKRTWPELRSWLRESVLQLVQTDTHPDNESSPVSWEDVIALLEDEAGPDLSLEEAAGRAGVHPVTFSRVFKQRVGVNFVRFMMERRLRKAKLLLHNRSVPVAAVAEAVGYADLRHFNRLFRQAFGMSPGEYRRQAFDSEGDEPGSKGSR